MGGKKKKAQKLSAHPKRVHHHSLECIDQTDEAAIGGDQQLSLVKGMDWHFLLHMTSFLLDSETFTSHSVAQVLC